MEGSESLIVLIFLPLHVFFWLGPVPRSLFLTNFTLCPLAPMHVFWTGDKSDFVFPPGFTPATAGGSASSILIGLAGATDSVSQRADAWAQVVNNLEVRWSARLASI